METNKALGNETTYKAPLTRLHEYNFDDDEFMIYGKASENASNKNFTKIHNGTIEYEQEVLPSLDVTLLPFEPTEECYEKLTFTWEVIDYKLDELEIKISFDEPKCVSASSNEGDTLRITFYE